MIKIRKGFYLHWTFFPALIMSVIVGKGCVFGILYCVALCHELFHIFAALMLSVSVHSLVLMPFGANARIASPLIKSPQKEIVIGLAGPLANGLMLALSYPFLAEASGGRWMVFMAANCSMLVLNLLPVLPLDGGRILRGVLCITSGNAIPAARVMHFVSVCVLGMLALAIGFLVFTSRISPESILFCAFLVFLFLREEKTDVYFAAQAILRAKEKLCTQKHLPCKTIAARETLSAKQLFSELEHTRFLVVYVIGEEGRRMGVLTEAELIEGAVSCGAGVSLSQLLFDKQIQKSEKQGEVLCARLP